MRILDKYELFIFDWDNTLSTSSFLVNVIPRLKHACIGEHKVHNTARYDHVIVKNFKIAETENEIKSIIYDLNTRIMKPKLKPSSAELINLLKRRHKKIAIFSNAQRDRLITEMRRLMPVNDFDFVLSASSIKGYKPNPLGLLILMNKFRIAKSKTLYVGDAVVDVEAAKYAGIDCAIVCDGLGAYGEIRQAKPAYIFKSVYALLENLKQ